MLKKRSNLKFHIFRHRKELQLRMRQRKGKEIGHRNDCHQVFKGNDLR